jgi:alanine racemase
MADDIETRPTRAEIDLNAIAANVRVACALAGPGAAVMAVVKADGYGHGAPQVARAALRAGATWLGVAVPEEAAALRAAGIQARTLVLGPIAPDQAALVVAHDLDQCVSDPAQAETLSREAVSHGRTLRLHLMVDTGMSRVGLPPRAVRPAAERIAALPGVRLAGLMTHFADADADDPAFTREQLARFDAVTQDLRAAGIAIPLRHAANSAALMRHPEARLDLVRPGIMLYGCPPCATRRPEDPALAPALRFRTAISQLTDLAAGGTVSYGRTYVAQRDMRIATLPVGYADGLSRLLSGHGQALIRGRRVPILGRVCMDMTMVDVTHVADVRVGDEAVLIGRQGAEEITADEAAGLTGTISYEVLCRIGPRVPRVYHGGDSTAATCAPSTTQTRPNLLDKADGPKL